MDPERMARIKQVQQQATSIKEMIKNLDTQYQSGNINQQEYTQKRGFLTDKLKTLHTEFEQLKG